MWNQQYAVIMQTQIGSRHGTMTVTVDQGRIEGMLDILKKANPFQGTINEQGDCRCKGELTTLMRTISYIATGQLNKESLTLRLKGDRETFELTGMAFVPGPNAEKEPAV